MNHPSTQTLRKGRPHVAIIMDGSGRWAVARGLPRLEGHRAGRATVIRTVLAALTREISILTLFTFSTENWQRPQGEVVALMQTFEEFFRVEALRLVGEGARISVIGRRDRLPRGLLEAIESVEAAGASNDRLWVRFAIDYSGRHAILAAARKIHDQPHSSEEDFAHHLSEQEHASETSPDIDLLIRTGGELRLSNCPLWEIAYAELHFTPCLWPDFGPADLDTSLREFHSRQRRFGRIPTELSGASVKGSS
jgi:undecaprenyl diphosphate synthase